MGIIFSQYLPKDHVLFAINDLHSETPEFHYKGIVKTLQDVKDTPNSYIVLGGDLIGAISPHDKRFWGETMGWKLVSATEAMSHVVEIFEPFKDKIILSMRGNHCRTVIKQTQIDVMRDNFCKPLGIRFGSDVAKIFITNRAGNVQYGVFNWHPDIGPPGGKQQDARKYKRAMDDFLYRHLAHEGEDCCVRVFPHIHQLHILRPEPELHVIGQSQDGLDAYYDQFVQFRDNKPLNKNMVYYIASGSYQLKSIPPQPKYDRDGNISEYVPVTTYAERKGFRPNELGYAKLIVKDYKIVDAQTVVV